ncbi:hypothetical protein ACNKHU_02000 [Shigella flexneri]
MRRRFFEKVFIIHYFGTFETILPNYKDGAKGRSMKISGEPFSSAHRWRYLNRPGNPGD